MGVELPGRHGAGLGTTGDTVVAAPRWALASMWLVFPVLGAGAGWLLKLAVAWLVTLSWVPMRGPFRLIASIPEPQATIGALAVGAVAGLVLAFLAAMDELTVTLSQDRVALRRGGITREIPRRAVTMAFLERRRLVLLSAAGEELAREQCDLSAGRLGEAFAAHGIPWRPDGDPHRHEYRRWVEGLPDLPAGADALFRARARALGRNDKEDAAQLRTELGRLGVVVRDEGKRQLWRRIPGDERS